MNEVSLGLLFSLTGVTSTTEKGQFQAARFAIHRYLQKSHHFVRLKMMDKTVLKRSFKIF
jgi:hypothetical protein